MSTWFTFRKATRYHMMQYGALRCDPMGTRIMAQLYTEEEYSSMTKIPRNRCRKCLATLNEENEKINVLQKLTALCTNSTQPNTAHQHLKEV